MKSLIRTCALLLGIAASSVGCANKSNIRYRVEGLVSEAWRSGPYRAPEPADIMDAHADSLVFQHFTSLIKRSAHPEQAEVLRDLIEEYAAPTTFRRVIETRRGLRALSALDNWIGHEPLSRSRRAVIEGVVTSERVIRDLPMLERIMNSAGHVDDDYESLRRAVLIDTRELNEGNKHASDARFWVCVRSVEARDISISLFGRPGAYTKELATDAGLRAAAWMRAKSIDGKVEESMAVSGGDTYTLHLVGKMALRVDMLPVLSSQDGTLMLISDPSTRVSSVYR